MYSGVKHVGGILNKPWVLLDCDGVLLDWDQGIQSYALAHKSHVWDGDHMDEHAYDLSTRMNITPEQSQELIWDFHHSAEYAHIPAMPGAVKAVTQLSKFCRLAVITACGTQHTTRMNRLKNLQAQFGDVFVHVHCTDSFEEKKTYLSAYDPGHWVEDHARNALMGKLYGHQCFLINAAHNASYTVEGVQRVDNLLQAADVILDTLRATLLRSHHNL